MFDSGLVDGVPDAGAPFIEDWFDPAWPDEVPWPDQAPDPQDTGQLPMSASAPSGG
ncbi:MAG: hypothetical protein ACRDSP_04120 [Pseudonocardiaceae bacterium]